MQPRRRTIATQAARILGALTLLASGSASADDWSGFQYLILIPVGLAAAFFAVVLATVKQLHGAVYTIATILYLPFVIFGFPLLLLPAQPQPNDLESAYVVAGSYLVVAVSFLVIQYRYWSRYIHVGAKQ